MTRGDGCGICAGVAPRTHEGIEESFQKRGMELLEPYRGIHTKVLIRGACGHKWKAEPNSVLNNGRGCPRCAGTQKRTIKAVDTAFQAKGLQLLGSYENGHTKVETRCLKCGYEWMARPTSIINTPSGCPGCAKTGFKDELPGILYYARLTNPSGGYLYKLGISNFPSIEGRFQQWEKKKISKVWIIKSYERGFEARMQELKLLRQHSDVRYSGPKILKRGDTELFNVDILGLDITI